MTITVNILKIIGVSILLFIITVFSQNVGILWHIFNLYTFEYVLHGLTYLFVTLILVRLMVGKVLKKNLSYFRIYPFSIYKLCLFLGFLLPAIVLMFYLIFIPGSFTMIDNKSTKNYIEILIETILIGGIVAPIVEEVIFRGILLKYIEERSNIIFATIITSILFSLVHLFNAKLAGIDLYLLIIAGTTAGIMYAVATYKYNSIWASVVLHIFWNLGGLLVITNSKVDYSIFQYVIKNNNVLITGGDYGDDASIISIIGYILVIIVIMFSKKLSN